MFWKQTTWAAMLLRMAGRVFVNMVKTTAMSPERDSGLADFCFTRASSIRVLPGCCSSWLFAEAQPQRLLGYQHKEMQL